ncbi:three-helix bundle dimerization domain-containing protein [Microbacterium deminutum]|uniref:DUF2662 domain-containing protein n=1 Tax=Microbacterium deminutum TaxID=344164 RepID=A0ABN2RCM5_9MICO
MTDQTPGAGGRDEQHEIDEVIERLAGRFPTIEHAHVEEIVREEAHKLDGGRVRDFVPVLVEHASHERLRLEAEPAPLDVAAEQQRLVPTDEPQELDPMEVDRRSQHTGLLYGDLDQ